MDTKLKKSKRVDKAGIGDGAYEDGVYAVGSGVSDSGVSGSGASGPGVGANAGSGEVIVAGQTLNTKKSNTIWYIVYGIVCVLMTAVTTVTAVAVSVFAALQEMQWAHQQTYSGNDIIYIGKITDKTKYYDLRDYSGILMLGGIVVAIVLMIVLMTMVGRFSKKQDGTYSLNWFDKIWTELHIFGVVCAAAGVVGITGVLYSEWMEGAYLGVWKWYRADEYYMDPIEVPALILAMVGCVIITLACFLALVKKTKGNEFWEESLLGGSFFAIVRGIKNSDKTLLKTMILMIAGCFLCATWIGLPICIILVLVFVPKLVKEFNEIRTGIEEVKNGNLSYKIPVEVDKKGTKTEFGRLAENINEISQASNLAIQNELKSQRLKTELISNVSHDLKTPLTSMVSYIHLLKQEGLDSENAPEYLDILDKKTQRLKALTENLFEAAKASSGAIPVNFEAIDISSLLTQSLAEMEERLAVRNLHVQVKNELAGDVGSVGGIGLGGAGSVNGGLGGAMAGGTSHETVKVRADGQLLWRVIENLLGNVSKYALEGSRVYINVSEQKVGDGTMIRLDVKNISADELNISSDELMERFKRGDESRNTEGSGLGLAIAKDLVKMMNGIFEITIDGDLFKATLMMEKA